MGLSVAMESCVAEELQPVRLRLPRQEFGGTLAHSLGPVAAGETPVVQEEPQQIQVRVADLATQEKVVAQSAVEILDDRTGETGAWKA